MAGSCPPHSFTDDGICTLCGITFREWARGFGSNVAPIKRQGYAALAATEAEHAAAHTKPQRTGLLQPVAPKESE